MRELADVHVKQTVPNITHNNKPESDKEIVNKDKCLNANF